MDKLKVIEPAANYVDDGSLRPQDNVDLTFFLALRDRAQLFPREGLPFFSGREAEINVFRRVLSDVGAGILANSTYVVQGPPGAGKTALLAQCVGEVAQCPPAVDGREWLPVVLHAGDTNSAQRVGEVIDRAIAARWALPDRERQRTDLLTNLRQLAEKTGGRERKIVRRAFQLLQESARAVERSPLEKLDEVFDEIALRIDSLLASARDKRSLAALKDFLRRGFSFTAFSVGATVGAARDRTNPSIADIAADRAGAWARYRIVLFVDEGQNIPTSAAGNAGEKATVLSMIHEARAGAALSLCVYGLPGTTLALRDAGISRTVAERSIRLGPLSDEDCRKAVSRCFSQFGVKNGSDWIDAIVTRSNGWPQHLAGYLAAAISEIARQPSPEKSGFDAQLANAGRALESGDKTRAAYYNHRIESLGPQFTDWAADLLPLFRNDAKPDRKKLVATLRQKNPSIRDDRIEEFLAAAIRSGILQYEPATRSISFPISSFCAYLAGEDPEPLPISAEA